MSYILWQLNKIFRDLHPALFLHPASGFFLILDCLTRQEGVWHLQVTFWCQKEDEQSWVFTGKNTNAWLAVFKLKGSDSRWSNLLVDWDEFQHRSQNTAKLGRWRNIQINLSTLLCFCFTPQSLLAVYHRLDVPFFCQLLIFTLNLLTFHIILIKEKNRRVCFNKKK